MKIADIYGSHFEYNNKNSREYGLVIANVTTDRMLNIMGEIEGVTIFNKSSNKRSLISDNKSDFPLSFDVEIITVHQKPIDYQDRRVIEKWLFNNHEYHKLYFDMMDDPTCETYELVDGEIKRNYLNCRFINPEKLEYNGGIVGYKATLKADSGVFWQDPIIKSYTFNKSTPSAPSLIQITTDTDLDDYIYPKVTLHIGDQGGNIIIINQTDGSTRLTQFAQVQANATIIMRGDINYISGDYYKKFVGSNFIRLLDGINNFTIIGDVANMTVEFQNRRAF